MEAATDVRLGMDYIHVDKKSHQVCNDIVYDPLWYSLLQNRTVVERETRFVATDVF